MVAPPRNIAYKYRGQDERALRAGLTPAPLPRGARHMCASPASGENLTLGTLARPSRKRMNVEIELPLAGERLC